MNNATYPAKITGLRRQHLFFALCWTAYFSTYIGRLNFTASLAAISAAAGFSQSELGLVSSGFFVGYGIFQCCFSKRMRKLFIKNEKSVLRFCNKSSKTKRAFTKVLMPCKRPF